MKNIELTTEEAINYLKENVKIHDGIEIAYDRIFAEGEAKCLFLLMKVHLELQ